VRYYESRDSLVHVQRHFAVECIPISLSYRICIEMNCSTNGIEFSHRCICDRGWFGQDCSLGMFVLRMMLFGCNATISDHSCGIFFMCVADDAAYDQPAYRIVYQKSATACLIVGVLSSVLCLWRFASVTATIVKMTPKRNQGLACRIVHLCVKDERARFLLMQLVFGIIMSIMLVDQYGFKGIYSRRTAQILHDVGSMGSILVAVGATRLFAAIVAKFDPRTKHFLPIFTSLSIFLVISTTVAVFVYLLIPAQHVRIAMSYALNWCLSVLLVALVIATSIYGITVLSPSRNIGRDSKPSESRALARMRRLVRLQQVSHYAFCASCLF
jgi:hypothetical protein